MVQTTYSWETVVAQVKKEYPNLPSRSFKFKVLAVSKGEEYGLINSQAIQLAQYLGLKLYPRPLGIPETWTTKICKKFLSQKYINPLEGREYLVVVPPDYLGGLPYVIQRTINGWADIRWFCEVIPYLNDILKSTEGINPFQYQFCEIVNRNKLTSGQVQAFNLFFEKFVPGIDGICSTCFQVMLPRSGAGERWVQFKDGKTFEVRLSAAKPDGLPGQCTEYVSQTIVDQNNKFTFAMWNPVKSEVEYTKNMKQEPTHIPWDIYDYNKFNIGFPVCQCKNNFK